MIVWYGSPYTLEEATQAEGQDQMGQETVETLFAGGLERRYRLHVPTRPGRRAPLVLALHGRLGSGAKISRQSGFNTLSEKYGFMAVYPEGVRRSWADGRGITQADRAHIDDVGFVAKLLDRLPGQLPVDPARVLLVGHSNGGFMVFRLLGEMPERFAGAAVVAAALPERLAGSLHFKSPLPVLFVHGTADPIIPYTGLRLPDGRRILGVEESASHVARLNGCPAEPVRHPGPVFSPTIRTTYLIHEGHRCRVRVLRIEGAGHGWPGAQEAEERWGPAVRCDSLWIAGEILRFLSPRLGAPAADA